MKETKVNMFYSQGIKIACCVGILVTIALLACLSKLLPSYQESMEASTQSNMLNVASAYSQLVEKEESKAGTMLTYEEYAELLKNAKLTGVESSYAYLVDMNGTMLYHPTEEKVGQSVENEVVKGVVADIQAGKIPEDAVTVYDFKGVMKYASYAVLASKDILVISADEAEVLAAVTAVRKDSIVIAAVLIIFSIICGIVVSFILIAPLKKITFIIHATSQFNFKPNSVSTKLCKRKDEAGDMARAVHVMRKNLKRVVEDLESVGNGITDNVEQLEKSSNLVNEMCTDNSATTQQLSAGMEETAATTESIQGNISQMKTSADSIKQLSVQGESTSIQIKQRAETLKETTKTARKKATELYKNVQEKSEKAIDDSKAVSKINELTNAIMSISSQTRLLALNASIEAARAGEAGRGFAVVATEIGNLAGQTSQTVGDIDTIVKEVNKAVVNMTESLQQAMSFIQDTVAADYAKFSDVSIQYSEDAEVFRASMATVNQSITSLAGTINEITNAIEGIAATAGESASGVSEIAQKTADVVVKTGENYKLVNECNDYVVKLKESVALFILE